MASFFLFYSRDPCGTPPPPYQASASAAVDTRNTGQAGTPRERFDYATGLKKQQLYIQWKECGIPEDDYGSLSQEKLAWSLVIRRWKKDGVWRQEWPDDGPPAGALWVPGESRDSHHPCWSASCWMRWITGSLCLTLPSFPVSRARAPGPIPAHQWNARWRVCLDIFLKPREAWQREGFYSKLVYPSIRSGSSMDELRTTFPEPVQEKLASRRSKTWEDLWRPPHNARTHQGRGYQPLSAGAGRIPQPPRVRDSTINSDRGSNSTSGIAPSSTSPQRPFTRSQRRLQMHPVGPKDGLQGPSSSPRSHAGRQSCHETGRQRPQNSLRLVRTRHTMLSCLL